jgi:hypothetical protein
MYINTVYKLVYIETKLTTNKIAVLLGSLERRTIYFR